MFSVDLVGILLTIPLVGLRYPHYVLFAAFIHDISRMLLTVLFNGNIDTVVAAGTFGSISIANPKGMITLLILFIGPAANFALSILYGGMAYERTKDIINPFVKPKNPLSVINFRFALISTLVTIWQLIMS